MSRVTECYFLSFSKACDVVSCFWVSASILATFLPRRVCFSRWRFCSFASFLAILDCSTFRKLMVSWRFYFSWSFSEILETWCLFRSLASRSVYCKSLSSSLDLLTATYNESFSPLPTLTSSLHPSISSPALSYSFFSYCFAVNFSMSICWFAWFKFVWSSVFFNFNLCKYSSLSYLSYFAVSLNSPNWVVSLYFSFAKVSTTLSVLPIWLSSFCRILSSSCTWSFYFSDFLFKVACYWVRPLNSESSFARSYEYFRFLAFASFETIICFLSWFYTFFFSSTTC
jgi:hypothetical protein